PVFVALTNYTYDELNRRIATESKVGDPNGTSIWTITQYDERNFARAELVQYTNQFFARQLTGVGAIMKFRSEYDAYGNKTRQTDAIGNAQTWTYNTAPAAGDYTFGQLVSSTSGGRTTGFSYNDFGQVKQETYSGNGMSGDPNTANRRMY